jgi:hypothetical protein
MWLRSLLLIPSLLHRECSLCRLSCKNPLGRLQKAEKFAGAIQIRQQLAQSNDDSGGGGGGGDCSSSLTSSAAAANTINGWRDTLATTECKHLTSARQLLNMQPAALSFHHCLQALLTACSSVHRHP